MMWLAASHSCSGSDLLLEIPWSICVQVKGFLSAETWSWIFKWLVRQNDMRWAKFDLRDITTPLTLEIKDSPTELSQLEQMNPIQYEGERKHHRSFDWELSNLKVIQCRWNPSDVLYSFAITVSLTVLWNTTGYMTDPWPPAHNNKMFLFVLFFYRRDWFS